MTIIVDQFEPDEIFNLIKQSVTCVKQPLVHKGFADYLYFAADGHRVQIERKQCGELLSDIDHVEAQLRRELTAADETILLVEGIMEMTQFGVDVYKRLDGKLLYKLQRSYGTPKQPQHGLFHRIQSWFWQLDHSGISVYRTANIYDTASAIVSWFTNSQKEEHTTLRRYIKQRINPKEFDPRVLTLMGIEGVEIGEVRAKALIKEFGSVWAVVNAPISELVGVDGIGPVLARKLIDAVGRPYLE